MESLKVLYDLEVMAATLDVPVLKHFYSHFKPQQSKHLAAVMKNFHIREFETSDFRSAYQSLVDFLYGWEVGGGGGGGDSYDTNPTNPAATNNDKPGEATTADANPNGGLLPKRRARTIRLVDEIESQEADRLLKTFQTVAAIHRRILTKLYFELEEKVIALDGMPAASNVKHTNTADAGASNKKQPTRGPSVDNLAVESSDDMSVSSKSTRNSKFTSQDQGLGTSAPVPADSFPYPSNRPVAPGKPSMTVAKAESTQTFLNDIYSDIDHASEYTIFWLSTVIVILSLAECLDDQDSYHRYLMTLHNIASEFIGGIFKRLYHLFCVEIAPEGSLAFLLKEATTAENLGAPRMETNSRQVLSLVCRSLDSSHDLGSPEV